MRVLTLLTSAAVISVMPLQVFAAGEPTTPTETTTVCTDGKIWDEKTEKCIDPEHGFFSDDVIYRAARELAYDGQYDNAITVLYLAQNRDDPRILNYLGFSHRKAGRVALGMGYYEQALTIDPDYNLARSYMGQSLAEAGKLDAAEDQLLEIRARGGEGSWAEAALENALSDAGYASTY